MTHLSETHAASAPAPAARVDTGVRALGYVYLNTDSAVPEAGSIDAQRLIVGRFAQAQKVLLQDIIEETSTGLSRRSQPRLERLLRGDWGQDWDVLMVARLDRLTRDVRALNGILDRLQEAERHLVSIEEGIDTRTTTGQFCARLVGYFSAWDTSAVPDRTREWIARKRQKGEPIGHAPFGYTYVNKKLVARPDEVQVVKVIQRLRGQRLSYEKIARYLNGQKIPSKRGGGWYAETVKAVYCRSTPLESATGT